jgi:hypothetical protein
MTEAARRALALACAALPLVGCGNGNADAAPAPPGDAAAEAAAAHANAGPMAPRSDPDAGEIASDAGAGEKGTASDAGAGEERTASDADAGAAVPRAFVRLADWTPDAPSAGFDACLAPTGTSAWIGPLLAQTFPAGSLGQGGANGLQFPSVTEYFGVAPGQYDLQVVAPGSTDCTTGLLPVTRLPALGLGSRTTLATVGDVDPRGNDTGLKVAVFFDDVEATSREATVRIINVIPSVAYLDVGTGSLLAHDFAALFTSAGFGVVDSNLADGGSLGLTGYTSIAPVTAAQFSAHPTGTDTHDTATATNVSLAAGSVTTMAVINGANGGFPPQFLVCTDSGPASDDQTPCMVYAQ